jgi:hypothetical protein
MRVLLLGSTAAAITPASLAFAQDEDIATRVADLVHAGDFAGAATIMRKMVEEHPLDRLRRLILGQLCFGNGDFAAAADEFQRIEKRGGTKDDFAVFAIGELIAVGSPDKAALLAGSRLQDSASWLYLSLLRKGDAKAALSAGPRESIRTLLRGDATMKEYVDLQWQIMDAFLDGVAKRYGNHAEIADMVKVAQRAFARN